MRLIRLGADAIGAGRVRPTVIADRDVNALRVQVPWVNRSI